jgi:hypothetical protein
MDTGSNRSDEEEDSYYDPGSETDLEDDLEGNPAKGKR